MNAPKMTVTREKHMDHMVRMVPLIVLAYALQCYMIMSWGGISLVGNALIFLAVGLVTMIAGFVTYDMTHSVNFHDEFLVISIKWLRFERTVRYQEISEVLVADVGQSFTTLTLKTNAGKRHKFYFVDEADKIQAFLNDRSRPDFKVAA